MRKLAGACIIAATSIMTLGTAAGQGPIDWPCARMCIEVKPHDHQALMRKHGKKWVTVKSGRYSMKPGVVMSLPCCNAPPVFSGTFAAR